MKIKVDNGRDYSIDITELIVCLFLKEVFFAHINKFKIIFSRKKKV